MNVHVSVTGQIQIRKLTHRELKFPFKQSIPEPVKNSLRSKPWFPSEMLLCKQECENSSVVPLSVITSLTDNRRSAETGKKPRVDFGEEVCKGNTAVVGVSEVELACRVPLELFQALVILIGIL